MRYPMKMAMRAPKTQATTMAAVGGWLLPEDELEADCVAAGMVWIPFVVTMGYVFVRDVDEAVMRVK